MAMNGEKKSLLCGAWQEDAWERKGPRRTADVSIETQVRNSIRDALYMLSPMELDQVLVNGVSCRQQLTMDKRKAAQEKGSIKFGKLYFTALRAKYQTRGGRGGALRLSKDRPTTAQFRAVFEGMLAHPPRRADVKSWLLSQDPGTVSEPDCRGLYNLLSWQQPHLSTDTFEFCMDIVEHVARLGLRDRFPGLWPHITKKVDEILLQVCLPHDNPESEQYGFRTPNG